MNRRAILGLTQILSSLIPAGLIVESTAEDEDVIVISARAGVKERVYPLCGKASSRVHSQYVRGVSDLPCAGKKIELRLVARRFVCSAPLCRRRIFAERFDDWVVAERSRRTSRLEHVVHHLGLALGGRPAASIAKRLMVPVSNDTLFALNTQLSYVQQVSLFARHFGKSPDLLGREDIRTLSGLSDQREEAVAWFDPHSNCGAALSLQCDAREGLGA